MNSRPLSPVEVDEAINATCEMLEQLTEEYAMLCERAADAESEYRLRFYATLVRIKDSDTKRITDKEAEARATSLASNEFRAYKLSAAQLDSAKQALATHRARLDALRTLAANVRVLTGGN